MTKKTKITDVRPQASCRLYPEEKMAIARLPINTINTMPKYLTPTEFAKHMKVSRQTVYQWLKLGKIKREDIKLVKAVRTLIRQGAKIKIK